MAPLLEIKGLNTHFYTDDAAFLSLTPDLAWMPSDDTHRRPRFRWEISPS